MITPDDAILKILNYNCKKTKGSNEKGEKNWNLNFNFTTWIYSPYYSKVFVLGSLMM